MHSCWRTRPRRPYDTRRYSMGVTHCMSVGDYIQRSEMGSELVSNSQTGVPLELVGALFCESCPTG